MIFEATGDRRRRWEVVWCCLGSRIGGYQRIWGTGGKASLPRPLAVTGGLVLRETHN